MSYTEMRLPLLGAVFSYMGSFINCVHISKNIILLKELEKYFHFTLVKYFTNFRIKKSQKRGAIFDLPTLKSLIKIIMLFKLRQKSTLIRDFG